MNIILIVDSNKYYRDMLTSKLRHVNPIVEVKAVGKLSEALLIASQHNIFAFFIDIQLTDGNGLKLAHELRHMKKYKFAPIIFVTAIPTKEIEAFRTVHCYDYLIKPIYDKDLNRVINDLFKDYSEEIIKDEEDVLSLNFNGVQNIIHIKDILYIEFKLRRIVIITHLDEIAYKSISLKKFSKVLSSQFIQIHQSIIINRNFIKKIDFKSNIIELHGHKTKLPIGISFKKKLNTLF